MTTYHPRRTEKLLPVALKKPSTPTALSCWHDSDEVAIVIPDGAMPAHLNGIEVRSWSATADEWNALAGPAELRQPPFHCPDGLAAAAGVIVVEDDGRVWLVAPSNQFGGYAATFPKGRAEHGDDLRTTAVREAFEESGLKVRIEAFLIDSRRTQTQTRYYLARRVGGTPADMGWESQAVMLVPVAKLRQVASHPNDASIIAALETWHAGQPSAPVVRPADAALEAVSVPFLSVRTLAEDYTLVAELQNDVAVYQHIDAQSAVIGTRGHRPDDGSAGLIVHDTVSAASLEHKRAFRFAPSHLSHWRTTKSPVATLLNVLDQQGIVLKEQPPLR
jgi:ADP-ribose pyrophosphatase YjhB (NUDIX family)